MLLTPEQYRILYNRIVVAIDLARYYPTKAMDVDAVAKHCLRAPFSPEEHNSGRS